jgi:hypothetical protein
VGRTTSSAKKFDDWHYELLYACDNLVSLLSSQPHMTMAALHIN